MLSKSLYRFYFIFTVLKKLINDQIYPICRIQTSDVYRINREYGRWIRSWDLFELMSILTVQIYTQLRVHTYNLTPRHRSTCLGLDHYAIDRSAISSGCSWSHGCCNVSTRSFWNIVYGPRDERNSIPLVNQSVSFFIYIEFWAKFYLKIQTTDGIILIQVLKI